MNETVMQACLTTGGLRAARRILPARAIAHGVRGLLIPLVCLGMACVALTGCQPDEPDFERIKQGVVRVIAYYGQEASPGTDVIRSMGSGFVVNAGGFIVTNHHVVGSMHDPDGGKGKRQEPYVLREILVRLFEGGQILKARVVATDSLRDLAVLKVDFPGRLLPLTLARPGSIQDGVPVWGIGFPSVADVSSDASSKSKLTRGIISATIVNEEGVTLIQTDAGINLGNSGGPLIDREGRVVGINTIKSLKAEKVGWSVAAGELAYFLQQSGIAFSEQGAWSWSGVLALWMALSGVVIVGLAMFFHFRSRRRALSGPDASAFAPGPAQGPHRASAALAGRKACLVIRQGEGQGRRIPLQPGELVIGRDPSLAQVVFRSKKISRAHARILMAGSGQVILEDMASTNGVWFQGRRLNHSMRLYPGMEFALAQNEVILSFEINEASTPPAGRRTQPWQT